MVSQNGGPRGTMDHSGSTGHGGGEGYPKKWSTGGVFFVFFSPKKYFDTPIFVGKMMSNLTLAYFFPDGFWSHQENNEGHKVVSPRNVEG